jgi:hypothetical protein
VGKAILKRAVHDCEHSKKSTVEMNNATGVNEKKRFPGGIELRTTNCGKSKYSILLLLLPSQFSVFLYI